jgi:hypothetical protein
MHWRGDYIVVNEKESREVAALDGCHGQIDHAGQSVDDAAGREQDQSRFRKADDELRKAFLVNGGWDFGAVHGALLR